MQATLHVAGAGAPVARPSATVSLRTRTISKALKKGFLVGVNPLARETDPQDPGSGRYVILADDWARRAPSARLGHWAERLERDVHRDVKLRIVGPGAERVDPGSSWRLLTQESHQHRLAASEAASQHAVGKLLIGNRHTFLRRTL